TPLSAVSQMVLPPRPPLRMATRPSATAYIGSFQGANMSVPLWLRPPERGAPQLLLNEVRPGVKGQMNDPTWTDPEARCLARAAASACSLSYCADRLLHRLLSFS